ncbi:DUF600 domain-containing protein [Shouchella clausii]|uniref:DUF600 domain-containing protein n=1 Tax=Shouchella clausii TaxID=79880 RepID=A0A268NU94_SHOCL|nr:DUF600 domain-containing protein [Shouchella clausii]MDO7269342.1 DUF600 domain-containing protein [Shouchella clausii]MDO7289224.1 DUF600 domain-containing protein [Shouchella clausii]PAE87064.1 DUF600 domain-containing protein [Shouchella clausii]
MRKIFEDKFSELQADMVAICLEYVENRAEKIFIYGFFEEKVISSDFFYCINGKVVRKHKLNDAINNPIDFQYNTSGERQSGVLNILNNNIKKMIKLCEEYNREMPSEIKLIYNVVNNNLKADYKYGIVYSNQPEKTADDISMEWFEEMQSAL